MKLPDNHAERVERARLSLEGLAIGDAFGEMLAYNCARARERVEKGLMKWVNLKTCAALFASGWELLPVQPGGPKRCGQCLSLDPGIETADFAVIPIPALGLERVLHFGHRRIRAEREVSRREPARGIAEAIHNPKPRVERSRDSGRANTRGILPTANAPSVPAKPHLRRRIGEGCGQEAGTDGTTLFW